MTIDLKIVSLWVLLLGSSLSFRVLAGCEIDADCKSGKVCVQGRCAPPASALSAAPQRTCTRSSQCRGGELCLDSLCQPARMAQGRGPETAAPTRAPGSLDVTWYLGGGLGSISQGTVPASTPDPRLSTTAGLVMTGLEFAGDVYKNYGVAGLLQVNYSNYNNNGGPNPNDVNIKGILGARGRWEHFRATVGIGPVFSILAAQKRFFPDSQGNLQYVSTGVSFGIYARADVLLTQHIALYATLGLDGNVYSQSFPDGSSAALGQTDLGGGILLTF